MRQAIGKVVQGIEGEHLGQVDKRMAGHGKSQLRLTSFMASNSRDQKGRGIQNGSQCADPALIGVLGAEVAQQGIGHVALQQFGGPAFPLHQQKGESRFRAIVGMAAQEFGGGWR